MIEIKDLKKVNLTGDDLIIFQIRDGDFLRKSYREGLYHYIKKFISNDFLILPESVKVTVLNGIVGVEGLEIENSEEIGDPIKFDPEDLDIEDS